MSGAVTNPFEPQEVRTHRTVRTCWTCNTEHDLDEACSASHTVRSMRAAGKPGNELADHTTPDLFDTPDNGPGFGPVFTAGFDGEDACCGDGIIEGEEIRSDGQGGWIHAIPECEAYCRD